MQTLAREFDGALARIEISDEKRKRAQAAHTEVRSVLETSPLLREWGADTVLIGSYARHTGIHPGKDVDIFSKLTALDTSADPGYVFDEFAKVLEAAYGARAHRQARSVKIDFPDGGDDFSVDAVPAVRFRARWAIPNRDPGLWVGESRWMETDPEKLGELTTERNRSPLLSSRGMYVPTVKLIRQTRHHHLEDRKPGGLYFELMTYWTFEAGLARTGSFAEVFCDSLASAALQLRNHTSVPLIDPVLQRPYSPAPEPEELVHAAAKFESLAARARAALAADDECAAAIIWREILGRNPRGECFPLPEGCDSSGRKIGPVVSVQSSGPRRASPFG